MNAELAGLVADYVAARAALEKLETDLRYMETELKERVAIGEQATLPDGHGIRIQRPSKRFDAELARQILSPDQVAMVSEPAISRQLAERMLAPVLYEQLCRPGASPTVRLL